MLYEADFNFSLKLIWGHRLVRHAESHECLGTSNHGSRPGRQVADALLEKLLVYEFARLSRTSLITVDNDAKSCYDRIIKSLSGVACMSVGLPLTAALMHNKTHRGMSHSIRTRQGLLRPYSGVEGNELEGTGQGSGASPAIWLIYSASLLDAFRRFTLGIRVVSPFAALLVFILAVFYVDDGMPGVNDALESVALPLLVLLQQAEAASQSWERLLFASGGALELSKCFAYVLYWDHSDGTHRLLPPDEIPGCTSDGSQFLGPIELTYGDNPTRHKLVTESPWVGRRTLGVRLAPAGTWSDEYAFRRSQSRDLAISIAGSSIGKGTARLAYRMIVCPKLEYPLPVTQFTQLECDRIAAPALRACLSKMGYNPNMPREVVYGPVEAFGLGMHDYFIEQGIDHVSYFVGHLRQGSETSLLMIIQLEWCQIQAGTSINLLESPDILIDYIEGCWIMCMRDYLRTYEFRLEFSFPFRTYPHCDGDVYIMDAFRSSGSCTSTELVRLNACRIFLKVTRLSEITDSMGTALRQDALAGTASPFFRSKALWPRQGRPPVKCWTLWRQRLQRVSL
jgi:hypothetical protein